MSKLGIALGSGGARGLAHIGVLEELAKLGIEPDVVSGTSIGSLIGAGYCSGKLDDMRELALNLDLRTFVFRIMDFGMPHSGFVEGKRINALIEDLMPEVTFESLDKPFRCIAANLKTGEEVVFSEGPVHPAIRASISIPGIFTPAKSGGQFLVDGGLVNPIPVDQLLEMGATRTLAVDVNHGCLSRQVAPEKEKSERDKSTFDEWMQSIEAKLKKQESRHLDKIMDWFKSDDMPNMIDVMGFTLHIIENQIGKVRLKIDPPDLLIAPEVGDIEVLDFHHADEIIEAGRRCVHENEDKLKALLNR
ncbi:MAG: patatin-like phospholipase family protein [Verrucomicrobia bacterium]|nr:patatin-like phospholipase family protein [Verrucomicrobiota bacterium]MCH8526910.1 patatin-like phospholipase family protein [Kiritimatiellia bacterium]